MAPGTVAARGQGPSPRKKRLKAKSNGATPRASNARSAQPKRQHPTAAASIGLDEEVLSSDSEDERNAAHRSGLRVDGRGGNEDEEEEDDDDDDDEETADERRVRMAKEMLAKLESAKRARRRADAPPDADVGMGVDEGMGEGVGTDEGKDDDDDGVERELQRQAALDAGRHFESIAARLRNASPPPVQQCPRAHRLPPTALALSSDETTAFTAAKDGELVRHDLESGKRTRLTGKHPPRVGVAGIALSHDGRMLACGGADKLLHIWDTRLGTKVESFKGHRDALTALCFAGRKNELFSAASDRTVKVWNLDEMTYVETLFGHSDSITAVHSLSPDRAVSCGTDRTVRLWKVPEETQLVFHGHSAPIDCVRLVSNHAFVTGSQDGAPASAMSRDIWISTGDGLPVLLAGARNAPVDSRGSLFLWQATRKRPMATVHNAHGPIRGSAGVCNWVTALATVASTDLVASGSADGYVRFWRAAGDEGTLEEVHSAPVSGQEHRLGRWFRDPSGRNGIVVVPLPAALEP